MAKGMEAALRAMREARVVGEPVNDGPGPYVAVTEISAGVTIKRRGRPIKSDALTQARRAKAYRERKRE